MKILLSWLREFVDVPGSAQDIAATMSVRGFAVEGIEMVGDDAVIDFEITANRPDCMCVIGIAREVATAYGLQVRRPAVRGRDPLPERKADAKAPADPTPAGTAADVTADTSAPAATAVETEPAGPPGLYLTSLKAVEQLDVQTTIENPELCPRYAAAIAEVTVGDSPAWMQNRLRAAGVRPISNIVDVTNYVLLELGQPMHAFDKERLQGNQIRVRTAKAGERITTLDGQSRALSPDMLVIADAERAIAVAGVMGGADSEVTPATKTIVLESAYFQPSSVRRTSKSLGLKTEASMRFERGADPRLPVTAMERACALLAAIGAGRATGTVSDRHPSRIEPKQVRLRRARIAGFLGVTIPDADVRRILDGLGFALRDVDEGWDVTVPTRRVDVVREADVLEEVARHFGFERIPATFPALTTAAPPIDPRTARARVVRGVMTGAGFSEAVTFGFIGAEAAAPFADEADVVPIANPLSENFAVLRPSLLPGLVDAVAYNRRREQRDVRLFEVGARFSRSAGERRALACAWMGAASLEHWSGGARDVDFFDMKGLVDRIAAIFGIVIETNVGGASWLAAGRSAVLTAGGNTVGMVGQLAPAVAARHGLPSTDAVYVAELDVDRLEESTARSWRIEALPRYPSVTRDISMLVDAALASEAVRATIRHAAPDTLVLVREFDRYQGKGVPEDKVSLSLRLVFRSPDRTLTDAEVQAAMESIVDALKARHGAVQR
jgi:phenylalanyl-tRNA synthetase beta chain